VLAETMSMAKQAEAQRDLAIQQAQFMEQSKRQQATADKAYELQTNVMQQQVVAEQVKVQQIEKEQQIKVQEAEIARHEKELIATVLKGSEIEAQRIQNIAAAEKAKLTIEAEGRAAAARAQGVAQADITRLQGTAEADIILSKGEAEAKAMNVKAEAYQEWTQAAVVDKLITNMADVVRAMAEPLSKVDKITIVSTGTDAQTGANKITGDMTKIAAQVPALFEALSGMNLTDLMKNVKAMKPREDGPAIGNGEAK
jgi:flotillin